MTSLHYLIILSLAITGCSPDPKSAGDIPSATETEKDKSSPKNTDQPNDPNAQTPIDPTLPTATESGTTMNSYTKLTDAKCADPNLSLMSTETQLTMCDGSIKKGGLDLTNLISSNIKSGVSIAGTLGTNVNEAHADCTTDGQLGCISTTKFKAADSIKLLAANIKADIVIARAGANTIAELVVLQIPSIIIPIPWTRYNKQSKNAEFAKSVAPILVMQQDGLTPDSLLHSITNIQENWQVLKQKPKYHFDLDRSAAQNLVNLLIPYLT